MKTRLMQAIVILIVVMLTLPGCQSPLASIARTHNDLLNKNDFHNLMTLFTDDATLVLSPFCSADLPCKGKTQIEQAYRMAVQGNLIGKIVNLEVSGNTVKLRTEVQGETTKSVGIDRFILLGTQTYSGDKISKVVNEFDMSDAQTATFVQWMATQK